MKVDLANAAPIRILLLFNSMFPRTGGGRETGLYHLARHGKGSLSFDVVTLNGGRRPCVFADAADVMALHPVFSWQGLLGLPGYNHLARRCDASGSFPRIAAAGERWARRIRPQVVMSFDAGPLGLAALHIARATGALAIMNMRSFFAEEIGKTNRHLRARRAEFRDLETRVIREMDLILCNGEDTFAFCVQDRGRTRPTVVVHNGVDVERFRPDPARTWRARMGAQANEVVFLSANPIREIKGPGDAIRAFAQMDATLRGQARLVFVGKGDFRMYADLAAALGVAERISRLGFLTHDELPACLASADVALHPILFSAGTTHASLETLACGLPQVSYDRAGLKATCLPGRTGILVGGGDVAALSRAMEHLIRNPDERKAMGEKARVAALEFAWPRYVQRYTESIRRELTASRTLAGKNSTV